MRKKFFTVLNAAFITVVTLTACSKSADKPAGSNNNGSYTKQQLVGSYQIATVKQGTEDVKDEVYETCELDDVLTLHDNMIAENEDAGETCDTEGGSSEAPWSITGNKLTVAGVVFTIKSLTQSQLITTIDAPGSTQPIEIGFSRQ